MPIPSRPRVLASATLVKVLPCLILGSATTIFPPLSLTRLASTPSSVASSARPTSALCLVPQDPHLRLTIYPHNIVPVAMSEYDSDYESSYSGQSDESGRSGHSRHSHHSHHTHHSRHSKSSRSSKSSSGGSRRSVKTLVSRTAIRSTHPTIAFLKYAAGAPPGPVAVKRVKVKGMTEFDEDAYMNGHYEAVTRVVMDERNLYYWERPKFDDSISVIAGRTDGESSRRHRKHRKGHRSPPPQERFVPRQEDFQDDFQDDFQGPPQMHMPPMDMPMPPMNHHMHPNMGAPHMGPPPPNMPPFFNMHAQGPPPPPPSQPAFFNNTGQGAQRGDADWAN